MKTKIVAFRKLLKKITNPQKNDQELERDAAEYLIISQPNSGRTWLRVMIGNIFQELSGLKSIDPENISYFAELDRNLPYIKAVHERFKSPEDYEEKKVILLVRDPRDAVISNYYLKIKRDKNPKCLNKSLPEFIREWPYIDDFIQLCNTWKQYKNVPKAFLLLRYEDLRKDTHNELKRLTDFLGLSVADVVISNAISRASFENMRQKEIARKSSDTMDLKISEEHLKTRKAKLESYKEELSPEDIKFIDNKLNRELDPSYGYNYFTNLSGSLIE